MEDDGGMQWWEQQGQWEEFESIKGNPAPVSPVLTNGEKSWDSLQAITEAEITNVFHPAPSSDAATALLTSEHSEQKVSSA